MMTKVDNSGKGNCMYYAYGISLMYYLRALNNKETTEDIFNKLKLTGKDKDILRTLLTNGSQLQFTNTQIKDIENILGDATRALVAESTRQEFIDAPDATSLFATAWYGFEYLTKLALRKERPELSNLIDNAFNDRLYTEAEIYRVEGIKQAMQNYVESRIPIIIQKYDELWLEQTQNLKLNMTSGRDYHLFLKRILNGILDDETVSFFRKEGNKNLNLYIKRIQGQYIWGSDETLHDLNRAIQGERKVPDVGTVSDHKINLYIKNSQYTPNEEPHIILVNHGQFHWTSLIPNSYLGAADANYKNGKILDIEDILNNLKMKIYTINKDMKPKAWEAAKNLLKELETAKNIYLKLLKSETLSKSESLNTFKDICVLAIKNKLPILEKDLGWGTYLLNMVKKISSIIITFGQNSNFFPPTKPASVIAVSETLKTLEKFKNNEQLRTLRELKEEGPEEIQNQTLTLKAK